jgi:CheY-like chemotaxis protein
LAQVFGSRQLLNQEAVVRQSVLIVEDEPIIRMLAMEIVAEAGFNGIEAANADEALAILESRSDIAVVFADIDMPGSLNGMQLANQIRDRWPPTEIILTSGQLRPHNDRMPARAVYIPKPYQSSKIAQTLRGFTR